MTFIQGEKYLWKIPAEDAQAIASTAALCNISFPIAQTLLSRGFTTKEAIHDFLFSSYEKDVAHAATLKDAQKAVDRIMHAISHGERILIFGDYDVDGITSSALMMICLLPLNAQVNFFLPHRVRDGYGLSTRVVERAARNGYKLIITVDNGIAAFAPALRAKELGIDLIITDHHRPHEQVPEAYAIVNPHQASCTYPFKSFAGVGVTFKLLSLLYEYKKLSLPPKAYELLLLGTVADVVPLQGENRFWVRYGLHFVNKIESLSLQVLKRNGKIQKPKLSATDIGFSITPQINALGRLEDPRQGVQFLIGTDTQRVHDVGRILLELNEARKEIERSIVAQIVERIEKKQINLERDNIILASHSQWSPGVIGLVASRLVGMYGKPTILLHVTDSGKAKGSCRSIREFNMFDALQSAHHLLDQFGGHAQAAGLSLDVKHIDALKEHLEKRIVEKLTPFDLKQKIIIDAQAKLSDLTAKFITDLEHLAPFGNTNEHPLFYINNVVLIQKPQLLKEAHVKCFVFSEGVIKPVIFFNRPALLNTLLSFGQDPFSIAVHVNENVWNDRVSIELTGVDVYKGVV